MATTPVSLVSKPRRPRSRGDAAAPADGKLVRPNPGTDTLERPRLIRALSAHADRLLVLVVAEGGYGKTHALSIYARTLRHPCVWYSLKPSDADLVVFSRCLLAGFRGEFPRFGRAFERAIAEVKPGNRAAEMLAGTFATAISELRAPAVVAVLDDYQEVSSNSQVSTFMGTLLRRMPKRLRLIVAARAAPALPLERLRAAGEVFEIDAEHLRMTRDELGQLFAEVYDHPLSERELDALEHATQGWATGAHMIHESLRRSERGTLDQVLEDFRASNLELHDYVTAEVYGYLDPPTRQLLERTAPLERFDVGLAERLTGRRGLSRTLAALCERGLLRSFGSGESASFEWQDLVQRFVRQEVEAREGAWQALEGSVAEALAERGDLEAAVRHDLAAGLHDRAAALLRDLAPALLRQGRAPGLQDLLNQLPEETLRDDARLGLAMADAQQTLGAWDEAERRYHKVLERCRAATPPVAGAREVECRALIGMGKMLNLRGRHEQVLGIAERGLAMAGSLPLEIRVRLLQTKAGAHYYLGQFQAAIRILDQVRELLAGRDEPDLVLPTVHNLAVAYASQGRIREASDEFRFALAHVRGTDSPRAPLYLSNLAFLLTELGDLAEARRAAEDGLLAAQRFSNRAQECVCHQALAQIMAQSGDLEGALTALRRAEELNAELRMEVISADLLALRGRIFCARGEYGRGADFLRQAIERSAGRQDAPRLPEFQASLAWCELRAGRVLAARELLAPLERQVEASEDALLRTRVNYWLAEALLAIGAPGEAEPRLRVALELARERGYAHFMRTQAREESAPLVFALEHGIEPDLVSSALVEAGPAVESALLQIALEETQIVGEAAIAVLAEVGGPRSRTELQHVARTRRSLLPASRTALRRIDQRLSRGLPRVERSGGAPRLVLFGRPRLEVDGRAVPASAWRAQRAFHLLLYLSLHPRGASRDQLLEHFWPGRQAAAGRRNFHPTISYVRHVLPGSDVPPILHEAGHYRLNPDYPLTTDAWDFDRKLDEARVVSRPEDARAALESALEFAGGAFLEGLYADWADALQAGMRERLERALIRLGELRAASGEYELALEAFRKAAELDAYRESTRLALIECLFRLGDRRSAVIEYEKLKQTLLSELGVEPLAETEQTMRLLQSGGGRPDWPARPKPLAAQAVQAISVARISQVPRKSPGGASRS
jgi:LuxR family maltose regulon positive regulatory protein